MNENYFARGKLLLTGEYLVMNGASSIVLPLKFGQKLVVSHLTSDNNNLIYWKAYESGELWFQSLINKNTLDSTGFSNNEINNKVIRLLSAIKRISPAIFRFNGSLNLDFDMNFDRNWGFGSSSTMISLISQWAGVNPYELYYTIYNGSAYDIAASFANQPILYSIQNKIPEISEARFNPSFSQSLFFVYIGRKQSTEDEIAYINRRNGKHEKTARMISDISRQVLTCNTLSDFEQLMTKHENIVSDFLERPSVMEQHFSDYDVGIVKSLGAWGGDFVLMTCSQGRGHLANYLKKKGLNVIFEYNKLIYYPEAGNIKNETGREIISERHNP